MRREFFPVALRIFFLCVVLSLLFIYNRSFQVFQFPKAAGLAFFSVITLSLAAFSAGKNRRIPVNFMLIAFFTLFLWMVFKTLVSGCSPPAYYLPAFVSAAFFLLPQASGIEPRRYMLFINIAVFVSCVLALAQLALGAIRPYSFFGNPVFFGEFLLLCIPLLVVSFFTFKNNRLFFVLNLCLAIACALSAGSRAVLFSLLISGLFLVVMLFRTGFIKPSKNNVVIYSAFMAVFFFCLFLVPNFTRSISATLLRSAADVSAKSAAVSDRALLARVSLAMIKDNPVAGYGAAGFGYFHQKYQAAFLKADPSLKFVNSSYAHNDYLQLSVEAGLLGLFLFIIFVISIISGFDRILFLSGPDTFLPALGFITSVFACLLESFFNFPLFVLPSSALFFISCGFIYTLAPQNSGKTVKLSLVSGAAAIMLALALYNVPAGFISDIVFSRAVSTDKKYAPNHDRYYKTALNYTPKNFTVLSRLAASYVISSEFAESVLVFEKALAVRPYSADALFSLGTVQLKLEKYDLAEKTFRESLDLYPSFAAAHFCLAKTLTELKRDREASLELAIAVKLDPGVVSLDFSENVLSFQEITW